MDAELLALELIRDEGEVLHAYPDSEGYLTLGVGRLIDQRRGGGISTAESRYLLGNDIVRVQADLDHSLPWWRTLAEARQRALCNMEFNLGIAKLLGFRQMLAALQAGDYATAAAEALDSQWAEQVGDRARRIEAMIRQG